MKIVLRSESWALSAAAATTAAVLLLSQTGTDAIGLKKQERPPSALAAARFVCMCGYHS